jgi:hypothetical protein
MHYFRRLLLLLRMLSILGLACILASIPLYGMATGVVPSFLEWSMSDSRAVGIALDLDILGGACTFVVNMYALRFRRPGRAIYPLDSWQSQARWMLLLAALPLAALAAAIFSSVTPVLNLFLVVPPTLLGAGALLAAYFYAIGKWQALD